MMDALEGWAMATVILTGSTGGIGLAAVRRLARDGWWVLATGLGETEQAVALEAELAEEGQGAFVAANLCDEQTPARLVSEAVGRTGRLDAVVNNAGIHMLATVDETDMEAFDRILAVNLRAAVALSRAALPALRQAGGGTIVNVASEAGLVAVPRQVAYNVSKAALIMLTKSLAADHARDGIRAVSVCPGTTRTPLVAEAIRSAPDPEAHERMLASSRPANRLGRPEEIAEVIAFVLRPEVGYMTGSEVVIDGGYTAV
jgi:NAD(P)-dependent dehydrogenase (short-subunit alcohol dehydrogenase family)